jgi:hypothetical protein
MPKPGMCLEGLGKITNYLVRITDVAFKGSRSPSQVRVKRVTNMSIDSGPSLATHIIHFPRFNVLPDFVEEVTLNCMQCILEVFYPKHNVCVYEIPLKHMLHVSFWFYGPLLSLRNSPKAYVTCIILVLRPSVITTKFP